MKLRTLAKIAVVVCVVLLCMALAIYSFLRLNTEEHKQDFNLYTLVPQSAIAVFETDHVAALVDDINHLHCSQDNHFLYASELFVYIKDYLHTLVDEMPHGLSKQMDKMLLSFHELDTPMHQVLYCALGTGDYELVESFIEKYCTSVFPAKLFDYNGEDIRIYPLSDGRFLAAYMTQDFLAVSFQKNLIEEVIDARRKNKSLMNMPSFRLIKRNERSSVPATVYIRMKDVDMGKKTDGIRSQSYLGSWTEFDLKFTNDVIYCSGVSYATDTIQNFINALRKQQPIEGFAGERLPSTTFFYNRWAISDREIMLGFTSRQEYAKATYSDYIKQRDEDLLTFLNDFAGGSVISCLFLPQDTIDSLPCAVMNVPMNDEMAAEQALRLLLNSTQPELDAPQPPLFTPYYDFYPKSKNYRKYLLPRNTLLTQMTGITESALYTYACFYNGSLLLAPDSRSLSAYIDALERKSVLEGNPLYDDLSNGLSYSFNYLMAFDMEKMLYQPESYVRLLPNFFFRHGQKFFRHFIIAIQFICVDDITYPNIVLLYKHSTTDVYGDNV